MSKVTNADTAKINTLSGKFMISFFSKLKAKDFMNDQFLKGFYHAYTKVSKESEEQRECETSSLFEFYMEYLLRNSEYDMDKKHLKIAEMCENIKTAIFTPDEDGKKPITDKGSTVRKVTLNKAKALLVLSDFIKASCIVTYENPDEVLTQHDEEFRVATTANIIEEIKASGVIIPKAQKDAEFNRRNAMLEIWHDTEHKCNKFIDNDALATVLKKVYFIDGAAISFSTGRIETLLCQDAAKVQSENAPKLLVVTGQPKRAPISKKVGDIESDLPIEVLTAKRSGNSYRTIVNLVNGSAMTEVLKRNKTKIPNVYICSGSQMIPGGSADQGVETNESVVYWSTSYNLCIEQAEMAFPLKPTQLLVMPNILVFKDHSKAGYPMLPPQNGQKISIIMSPGIYRPATNLKNPYQHGVDERLYYPNAKYTNHKPIIDRYRSMLNAALFFGYDTVVLDDQGVKDFWLPAHHTSALLNQVINEFRGKFKEIVVAVEDKSVYEMFKKYIR